MMGLDSGRLRQPHHVAGETQSTSSFILTFPLTPDTGTVLYRYRFTECTPSTVLALLAIVASTIAYLPKLNQLLLAPWRRLRKGRL